MLRYRNRVATLQHVVLPRFDFLSFRDALDAVRRARHTTWRQVARDASVSASSITRMGQGSRADIDTIAALASWGGLDVEDFFPQENPQTKDPLAVVAAYLRRDPVLSDDDAAALEQVLRATYSQLARPE